MKKVIFIVLASAFMMPSYHLHAAQASAGAGEGGDEVQVDSERANELGKQLIEDIVINPTNLKERVKKLLEKGANVNVKDQYDCIALMEAAKNGHAEIVQMLLANGAQVNMQNKYGYTALMWAIIAGHTDMALSLIYAGTQLDLANSNNETALMLATEKGCVEIVEMLLGAGADPTIQNKDNKTALDLCPDVREDIRTMLLNAQEESNSVGNYIIK